jgi:Uma2 family endonuclease
MKPLKKYATYADLCEVPDNFVAELFDGELYAFPRPALPHAHAGSVLGHKVGVFHRSGPGGWVILDEPELHFRNDVLVPDMAGWRRERLPAVPPDAFMTLSPDWVCEILSRSTESIDRGKKLQRYAREGVSHVWLVDPLQQSLEVLTLALGRWTLLGRHQGQAHVRAAPFDAIELELGALWIG